MRREQAAQDQLNGEEAGSAKAVVQRIFRDGLWAVMMVPEWLDEEGAEIRRVCAAVRVGRPVHNAGREVRHPVAHETESQRPEPMGLFRRHVDSHQ